MLKKTVPGLQIIAGRHCSCYALNINKSQSKRGEITKRKHRNQLLGYKDGIISHIVGSKQFFNERRAISNCRNALQVKSILDDLIIRNRNEEILMDETIYGKALQKCLTLCEWTHAINIFNKMPEKLKTLIIYNIMINGLCKNDKLKIACGIFEEMRNKGIEPDRQTYTNLINGCKMRPITNISVAETFWKQMLSKGIEPDLMSYNAIIAVYAKSKQLDKVESIWNEILRLNQDELDMVGMAAICGNVMNCYALCKQTEKVMEIKDFMNENKIALSHIHFSIIIKCFQLNNKPKKILEIFNNEIFNNKSIKVEHVLINQLSVAILQLMKRETNYKLQSKYCDIITKIIPNKYNAQWNEYHVNNYHIGSVQFDALLLKYKLKNKEHKLQTKFRKMIKEKKLHGYWTQIAIKDDRDKWVIDLHSHSIDTSKWILKYIFEYSKREKKYIKQCLDRNQDIIILCGQGVHNQNNDKLVLNKEIESELLLWTPSIKSKIHPENQACLLLNGNDLKKYF